jgi:putative endonuclease
MESPSRSEPDARGARGRAAEECAARHLAAHGLELLLRNWRCRMGEIDLVARDGSVLVIVEVRLRSRGDFGGAAASITHVKRRRIVNATRHLLMRQPQLRQLPIRFDVVALDGPAGRIDWIRGAFDAD